MSVGRKAILIILLFFVLVGGFYLYKVMDYTQTLEQIKAEIEKETEFITLIDQQLLEMENKPKVEDVANLYQKLPSERGLSQLLQFLDQVLLNNKITIQTIDFEESAGNITLQNSDINSSEQSDEELGIVTISMHMTVSGDYEDLRNFISDVYDSQRLINLGKWQWETDSGELEVELTFNTYYSPKVNGIISPLPPIPTYAPSLTNNPT